MALTSTMIYKKNILPIFFIFISFLLQAQLSLDTERANGTYEVGEIGYFVGQSTNNGTLSYRIFYDNKANNIETGKINVAVNTKFTIPYEAKEAGVYLCEIEQAGDTDIAAMAFSPHQIHAISDEPSDYDAFWENNKQELATIPIDAKLNFLSIYQDRTSYTIDVATADNLSVIHI